MAMMSKTEAKALMEKVLGFSQADECEINLIGTNVSNVRTARNAVSTSGSVSQFMLVVSSAYGKKLGTATINEFDDSSLEKVVRRSEELAKLAPENPEFVSFLEPQQYKESKAFVEATAQVTPQQLKEATASSLAIANKEKLIAAGFLENRYGFSSMMNSTGLFAYAPTTQTSFSITMRTEDGKGSGYAINGYNDFTKLNTTKAAERAAQKASGSATARALEPGKYTVILEPAAGAVLLENIFYNMDARQADEGRSFMSKAGGGTRIGEQMVDKRVNIYSDPLNPELPTKTWTDDGRPLEKTYWIENGIMKNLYYSRYWAQKQGVKATPSPEAIIMDGGTASLDELIKGTDKGILITRLWYIRSVDPQTLLLTGLTRDGTFYIENGQIKFPVKNFRFNESPVIMLNNLEELGKTERTISGESENHYLIPPMKIRDFTFTSLSDAV